jgi:hypothetical protein
MASNTQIFGLQDCSHSSNYRNPCMKAQFSKEKSIMQTLKHHKKIGLR